MERKNAWKDYTKKEIKELEKLNKQYREFLNAGKTERECVIQAVSLAEKAGYRDLKAVIEAGAILQPGDKVYSVNMIHFPLSDRKEADGKGNGDTGSSY